MDLASSALSLLVTLLLYPLALLSSQCPHVCPCCQFCWLLSCSDLLVCPVTLTFHCSTSDFHWWFSCQNRGGHIWSCLAQAVPSASSLCGWQGLAQDTGQCKGHQGAVSCWLGLAILSLSLSPFLIRPSSLCLVWILSELSWVSQCWAGPGIGGSLLEGV